MFSTSLTKTNLMFSKSFSSSFVSARRSFSSAAPPANLIRFPLDQLQVVTTVHPKPKVPNEKLVFGKTFTDHMFTVLWNHDLGWHTPKILPYGPLSLYPSATVLHYGLECFEGMKAYKDVKGNIRMFRPEKNMERLNRSSTRLTLPAFNGEDLLSCIRTLLKIDSDWIPTEKGYSVYIRPFAIATQPELGVSPVKESMIGVVCCPVGPYYPEGFKPVSLYADALHVRAVPGGVGSYKIGGNYAPTVLPARLAASKGYSQVLWLFEDVITEVGTMNMFIYWINEQGEKELLTPPLEEGTILPGVTRLSIMELAKEWNEFKLTERALTMSELIRALNEDRVFECFGAGTAAIVTPIKLIHYKDQDFKIPLDKNDPSAPIGPLARRVVETLMAIQYGDIDHPWSVPF